MCFSCLHWNITHIKFFKEENKKKKTHAGFKNTGQVDDDVQTDDLKLMKVVNEA